MKKFFGKIFGYIKNNAWIQPLLIVTVIFLCLFLLEPISKGIGNLWSAIFNKNPMTEITYAEYVKEVKQSDDDDKFIVVFTQDNCAGCAEFRDLVDDYLDKYPNVTVYEVDLTLKSGRTYKDKTIGTIEDLYTLDQRISEFNSTTEAGLTPLNEGEYAFINTPLIIWYVGGVEAKIEIGSTGSSDFVNFMRFPETVNQTWANDYAFDLTAK